MKLCLRGIEVFCIIGDRTEERLHEQRLRVDVDLEIDPRSAETDDLCDTVDYVELAGVIRAALVSAKCRMIEHAAKVVADACRAYRCVVSVRASVAKAGVVPGIESASAEFSMSASCRLSMAERLVSLLKANGMTCAAAESCTGGGIGSAITSVPGSSEVFKGGVVSYANEVKKNVLGVGDGTLSTFGAVSSETAAEMAVGARRLMRTDIAVSVTGIAGPGGGSDEKPVGLVWFGLATKDGVRTEKAIFCGDRDRVREQAVLHALGMLNAAAVK